ncbi:hypothetical protein OPIT5_24940 [Opitutaceae bacterium TAV5]|nr:hypothetical protein OPIT5_24940 [Opitutaceae bacterium TAV5]
MATKNTKKQAAHETLHRAYKRAGEFRREQRFFVFFVAISSVAAQSPRTLSRLEKNSPEEVCHGR